jgi:hypothetical protein
VLGLLPPAAAYRYAQIEPYGLVILIVLVAFPGILGTLLAIPYALSLAVLKGLLGI